MLAIKLGGPSVTSPQHLHGRGDAGEPGLTNRQCRHKGLKQSHPGFGDRSENGCVRLLNLNVCSPQTGHIRMEPSATVSESSGVMVVRPQGKARIARNSPKLGIPASINGRGHRVRTLSEAQNLEFAV